MGSSSWQNFGESLKRLQRAATCVVCLGVRSMTSRCDDVFLREHVSTAITIDPINLWCSLFQYWNDFRLKWNSSHYGAIRSFVTSSKKVWLPDITLYNKWAWNKSMYFLRIFTYFAIRTGWPVSTLRTRVKRDAKHHLVSWKNIEWMSKYLGTTCQYIAFSNSKIIHHVVITATVFGSLIP